MKLITRIFQTARLHDNIKSFSKTTTILISDGILNSGSGNFFFKLPNCSHAEEDFKSSFLKGFALIENFIAPKEEKALLEDVQKPLSRLKYEYDHWDGVIYGYRELEKSRWSTKSTQILDKIKSQAFDDKAIMLPVVHVLDLSKDGYIKPHVDSKFCGCCIAGVSLLSSSVMRLKPKDCTTSSCFVDVLLKPRSLYIMRDHARYELTHEILPDECSYFKNLKIDRDRRISIVMREEPVNT